MDHQLRQEKETIEDTQIGLKDGLFRRRQEAFGIARQQEREKGEHYLEAIVGLAFSFVYLFYREMSSYAHTMQSHRLQVAQEEFKASLLSQQNVVPPIEPREPSMEQPDQLIAVSTHPSRLFEYSSTLQFIAIMRGVWGKIVTFSIGGGPSVTSSQSSPCMFICTHSGTYIADIKTNFTLWSKHTTLTFFRRCSLCWSKPQR